MNFGDNRYQDYTQHHDIERQKKYLIRHKNDPTAYDTPGELSRIILWSAPSLRGGIKNYTRKHRIVVRL